MSADQRYMYHSHPQGMPPSSYDYQSYAPSSFEAQPAPLPPAPVRSIRSNSSQSHSPQQPQNFAPPSTYAQPSGYTPAPYSHSASHSHPSPAQQQQWPAEQWPPPYTAQPFPHHQSMEMTYASGPSRTEPAPPASPPEARSFVPVPSSQTAETRRQDERYAPVTDMTGSTTQQKSKRRDKESPAASMSPAAGSNLDFMKMLESYRLIIDASNSLTGRAAPASGRPTPPEVLEELLQSANYGVQMLQSATAQPTTDIHPAPAPAPAIEEKSVVLTSKRQKPEDQSTEGQTCLGCNATSTPEWRRGPLGPRTLCNACGLVYAKLLKKRARGEGRSRVGSHPGHDAHNINAMDESGAASSGDGGSEDEDSYGSQDRDRRSDFGDQPRRG
ncbi:hypothetical protein BJ138DRAFT_1156385 [Hygrophoropsis aurantiaca]|uniref:Uncharacterized protein n=1 Tax=Hygrophoropsis aurantiaca TaxID=72124 RepID=A0ACB8A7D2_9AGAM|nr:hypothetical protein BJ138DRAFT_1156385 [Hygrophoropsis aurantiaca]